MNKKLISLVVPVLNEAENVLHFYETVSQVIAPLETQYDFEFIFTDNHSTDNTFELLQGLAKKDARINVYRFSRNFGYQRSILTGYAKAKGDALIQIDCDLQDPPTMIKEFIEAWEEGNKVVYGVRLTRKENIFISTIRKIFYRLIDAMCDYKLPHDAGDFRLVDRFVVNELIKTNNFAPYLRGDIAYIGYQQKGIHYHRESRRNGVSKFAMSDLFKLAFDGIISHSILPLRIATYCGLFIALSTFLFSFICIVAHYFGGAAWPRGFATTTVLILFSISLNASFLGIIGEYVGRIYNQVVQRSLVVIEAEILGLQPETSKINSVNKGLVYPSAADELGSSALTSLTKDFA